MPLYTVTTQSGALSHVAKSDLAARLTSMHCELSGVPRSWVHIIFQDYGVGSGFTAGQPAATVALTLLVRTGRSPEYLRHLVQQLWNLVQQATSAADDQIVIGIQEVPAHQAMEMGQIMPDVTQ